MRMGQSADDSVLDANAEARWVSRLFVADNAALANGLGGPKPDADDSGARHPNRGEDLPEVLRWRPWVARESPAASTDERITKALPQPGM